MRTLIVMALLAAAPAALADEKAYKLKDGPDVALVKANCTMCHSLDYIQMNSPFLDRKGWEGEVGKMVKVFDAKIKPEDAPKIVDYLVKFYGKPDAPPAAAPAK
ncbi:MAG: hypothetical protein U0229_24300 [Anaeromyxobacter sp.]